MMKSQLKLTKVKNQPDLKNKLIVAMFISLLMKSKSKQIKVQSLLGLKRLKIKINKMRNLVSNNK